MPGNGKHSVNTIDSFFKERPSFSNVREGETVSFLEKGNLVKLEKRNGVIYQSSYKEVVSTSSLDTSSEESDITSVLAGTGLSGGGSSGDVTLSINSTVATLTGSQTLTNKTLTSPVINTGVSGTAILDENDMSSDSDTKLATQQSIKAYVDSEISGIAAPANATITLSPGAGIGSIGNFTTNQSSNETLTIGVDGVLEDLDAMTAVSSANQFIVSTGSGAYHHENATNARLSLGLGDLAIKDEISDSDIASDANIQISKLEESAVTITAGAGLTDGGSVALGSSTTLNIGAGTGITVNANDVALTNTSVSYGGVSVALGASDATPAFDLQDATGLPIIGGTTGTLSIARGGTGGTNTTTARSNLGLGDLAILDTISDNQVASDASIAITKLAASSINVTDGSSSTSISLGNSITFSGTANEVTVGESSGEITVGLPNDVVIANSLVVNGTTTTIDTTNLIVEDPLIKLAKANNAADSVDIGFYGLYDTSGTDKYAGLFRDANDSGKFKLFKDLQDEPTTTVDVSGTGYAKATLVADLEGNVTGNVTGNAGTATKLANARDITLIGDITGVTPGAGFDGSAAVSIDTTIANNSVALGTKTTGNYVATLTAGNLIDLQNNSGEGATPTIDVDLSELNTSVSDGDGDFFAVVDSSNAQKKLTKGNINLSGFNNDSGFTSNAGTVTSVTVTGGDGLTGGGSAITSSGTATLAVGSSSLAVTANAVDIAYSALSPISDDIATGDHLIFFDASNSNAVQIGTVSDLPFTNNAGTITSVTGGSGLTGSGSSGGVTLAVGAGTGITANANDIAIDSTVVATLSGTQTFSGSKTFTSHVILPDNISVLFGAGNNFQIGHKATYSHIVTYEGHLFIDNNADGQDIVLRADDGGGGLANYIVLDSSDTSVDIHQDIKLTNTKKLYLDNGLDTFINETAPNVIGFTTGGGERARIDTAGLLIPSGRQLNFNNSSDQNYGRITADSEGLTFDTVANRHIRFKKQGTEVMRIDTSGRLGVGTAHPASPLEVNGNVAFGDTATGIKGTIHSTDEYRINGLDVDEGGWNSLHLRADGTDGLFIQKDTNRVGIGTSSPETPLHVNQDSNDHAFKVTGGGGGASIARFVRDIGLSSPYAEINIHAGSGDPQISFRDVGNSVFALGLDDSGNSFKISQNASIGTNDRFAISSSGAIRFNDAYTFPTSDGASNKVLKTNGSGTLSFGDTMNSWTLQGDSGSNQSVTDNNVVDIAGGTGISTAISLSQGVDIATINLDASINDLSDVTINSGTLADGQILQYSSGESAFINATNQAITMSGSTTNGVLTRNTSTQATVESSLTFDGAALNLLTTTANRRIEIGLGATQDVTSFVDLIGDTTYSDYGGRFIRYGGANAETRIMHRGTGDLVLLAQDSAAISLRTGSTERLKITSSGDVILKDDRVLYVGDDLTNGLRLFHLASNNNNYIRSNGGALNILTATSQPIYLNTNNTNALTIDTSQRVGIGETSPDTLLHIKNTGSGSTSTLKLEDNARVMYLGRDAIAVQDLSGSAAQMYINSNTTFSGNIVTGGNIDVGGLLSVTSSISTGYGVNLTNGNTNFLLYNNSGEDVLYMRDTTNGQMLQTWRVSSVDIHRGLTINQDGGNYDTRIESDDITHMFFVDASANKIAIGNTTADATLHIGHASSDFSLGGTSGNSVDNLKIESSSANANQLIFSTERISNGSDWTTSREQIRRRVDVTDMGYIQFGSSFGSNDMVGIGRTGVGTGFIVDGNLKVGIGITSSLAAKLHVQDSDGSNLARFKDSDSSYAGIIIAADTNGGHVGNSGGYAGEGIYFQDSIEVMRFYAAGGERMRLTGTGRLGIGTTGPSTDLHINTTDDGSVTFTRDGTHKYSIEHDTSQIYLYNRTLNKNQIMFSHSGPVTINNDGHSTIDFRVEGDSDQNLLFTDASADKVSIGHNAPLEKLDVNGVAKFRGTSSSSKVLELGQLSYNANVEAINISYFDDTSGGTSLLTSGDHLEIHGGRWGSRTTITRGGQGGAVPIASLYGAGSEAWLELYEPTSPTDSQAYETKIRLRANSHSYFMNNLAIGTTTAEGKVHIYNGDSNTTPDTDGDELVVENSNRSGISILSGTGSGSIGSVIFGSSDDANGAGITWQNYINTLTVKTQNTAGILRFASNNNVEAMRILANGNVGIGDDNPPNKLSVKGSSTDLLYLEGDGITSNSIIQSATGGSTRIRSAGGKVEFYTGGSANSSGASGADFAMVVNASQNVGIGTTSPKTKLDIENTTAPTLSNDTHAGEAIFLRSGGSAGDGNVQAVLAFGKADSSSRRSGSAIASVQTDSDADKVGVGFYTSDSSSSSQTMDLRMLLNHTGNLHVDADVVAFSTSVSDKKLKDNVKTISNPLDKVMALRGVEFDWNKGNRKGQKDLGLIAQEVEKVLPEIVREKKMAFIDNEIYKTIDYDKVVGVLIEAIKEQQEQINKLEEKLNG